MSRGTFGGIALRPEGLALCVGPHEVGVGIASSEGRRRATDDKATIRGEDDGIGYLVPLAAIGVGPGLASLAVDSMNQRSFDPAPAAAYSSSK